MLFTPVDRQSKLIDRAREKIPGMRVVPFFWAGEVGGYFFCNGFFFNKIAGWRSVPHHVPCASILDFKHVFDCDCWVTRSVVFVLVAL